jgi:hypothetical protein
MRRTGRDRDTLDFSRAPRIDQGDGTLDFSKAEKIDTTSAHLHTTHAYHTPARMIYFANHWDGRLDSLAPDESLRSTSMLRFRRGYGLEERTAD